MATNYNAGITTTSTTAANIQAFATFISTLLTSGGWTQSGDSGQQASASWPAATSTNNPGGYQIWHMTDTLAGSYPIYIKLEYGSGTSAAYFGFWCTIGTGSNGSGTITGIIGARTYLSNTLGSGSYPCYGSATTSKLVIAMFATTGGGAAGLMYSIERAKDTSYADTGSGVIVWGYGHQYAAIDQYIDYAGTLSKSFSVSASPYFTMAQLPTSYATGSDGAGNLAIFPILPWGKYGAMTPGYNLLVYYGTDLSAYNSVTVSVAGSNHTFMTLGAQAMLPSIGGWTGSALMLLYE